MAEEKKIATGYIGNALRSAADNHTTTFADEVFDTERQKYQNEVNTDLETTDNEIKADLEAEKAAIMGTERIADGAVTTEKLNSELQAIISNVSKNASFAGLATPSTNPLIPDGPVFYIAKTAGTYVNFDNIEVGKNQVVALSNKDGSWKKYILDDNNVSINEAINNVIGTLVSSAGISNTPKYQHTESVAAGKRDFTLNGLDLSSGVEYRVLVIPDDHSVFNKIVFHLFNSEGTAIKYLDKDCINSKIFGREYFEFVFNLSESGIYNLKIVTATTQAVALRVIVEQICDNKVDAIHTKLINSDIWLDAINWYQCTVNSGGNYEYSETRISSEYVHLNGSFRFLYDDSVYLLRCRYRKNIGTVYNIVNGGEITIDDDDVVFIINRNDATAISPKDVANVKLRYEKVDLIAEGSVTTKKIADGAVTTEKLNSELQAALAALSVKKYTILELNLENGTCNGGGSDVDSSMKIRTQKIPTKNNCLYIVTTPEGISCVINYKYLPNGTRLNGSSQTSGLSIRGDSQDFIRILYQRTDGTSLQMENLTDTEKSEICVYEINQISSQDYDILLAAQDSMTSDKEKATLVLDENNAQLVIAALMSSIDPIKIFLFGGSYYMSRVYKTDISGSSYMLKTYEERKQPSGTCVSVEFYGKYSNRLYSHSTKFIMTEEAFNKLPSGLESSMLLVPKNSPDPTSYALSATTVVIKNISFLAYYYTKPCVIVNLRDSQSARLYGVSVRCDNKTTGTSTFDTKPNEGCVGIRVGYGSNSGIQNYIKSSYVMYAGKGISCCGEHFVFEDVLTHHCYIGFAFGDSATRGNFEHPNVMIGCSIEGCYRLMLLTKQGITEETTIKEARTKNPLVCSSTLVCIGLSTEMLWSIPLDEIQDDLSPTSQRTLLIKEIVKGAYVGRIEIDCSSNPFEEGSGKNIDFRAYGLGINPQIIEGRGNIV